MDNFIEEVDEELKRERQLALWNKYGRFAVAAVLVVVISVASFIGWRQYQTNQRVKAGLAYMAAGELLASGKREEARAAFNALGRDGAAGYGDLARFREAAILAGEGNPADAAKIYDAIARDDGVDAAFRDLALVLYALSVVDLSDPNTLMDRIKPLTDKANPWRFSALEITALLLGKRGDQKAAREIYQRLTDDPATPSRLRARAAEFLAITGG